MRTLLAVFLLFGAGVQADPKPVELVSNPCLISDSGNEFSIKYNVPKSIEIVRLYFRVDVEGYNNHYSYVEVPLKEQQNIIAQFPVFTPGVKKIKFFVTVIDTEGDITQSDEHTGVVVTAPQFCGNNTQPIDTNLPTHFPQPMDVGTGVPQGKSQFWRN